MGVFNTLSSWGNLIDLVCKLNTSAVSTLTKPKPWFEQIGNEWLKLLEISTHLNGFNIKTLFL